MLSAADQGIANTIFSLLKGSTSLAVVKEFLRAKKLPMSAGSWDEMFSERIQPRLNSGEVTLNELRDLLRSSEECGRQHVFLYQCDPGRASSMIAPSRVQAVVTAMGLGSLIASPLDLGLPADPTIVDIRGTAAADGTPTSLLVKQVETRETNKFLHTTFNAADNQMSRVYSVTKKRAVNIARLHSTGLLEIRIAAQDNSTKYEKPVATFFAALGKLLPANEFIPVPLGKSKTRIWQERKLLASEIRYNNSFAKNDFGNYLTLSTGTYDENLSNDQGCETALQSFLQNDGALTGSNLHFLVPGSDPVREIHILLSGDVNEFAITASCTTEDYEYVCGKIQSLNH